MRKYKANKRWLRRKPGIAVDGGNRGTAGYTITEVMIVMVLASMLVLAAINTISLVDRASRRQALHTAALEAAQGKIEELQSTAYSPPSSPYLATTNTQTASVALALTKSGSATLVPGVMTTTIAPVAKGHLVTVRVVTTNLTQLSVQLQTLINQWSGGQP